MNKNKIFKLLFILIITFSFIPFVYAGSFCDYNETRRILKIVGWIILLIRIVVPLLLIIFTMLDLTKAMTAKDEFEYKKMTKIILKRVIATILVFLIPTFIHIVLNISDDGKINNSVNDCKACINSPSKCKITGKSYLPVRPKMAPKNTSDFEKVQSIGYKWKWTNKKLVYLDSKGNIIKNKTFKINGVSYKAGSSGSVSPDVSNPVKSTEFSDYTNAIVNAHRYDFTSDNVSKVLSSYGGYNKYIKSLGGVFTKYADFKGKAKNAQEFYEIAEYVWGLYEIWGVDYSNGCEGSWGENMYRAHVGGGSRFYLNQSPSDRYNVNYGCKSFANGSDLPTVDKMFGSPSKYYAVVNCGQGVLQFLKKAGFVKGNLEDPGYTIANWVSNGYHAKVITDASQLQVGDVLIYANHSNLGAKTEISSWKSGTDHTNIVIKKDTKKKTLTFSDSGHAYTYSGEGFYTKEIGQWPYTWAQDWVAYRIEEINKYTRK